MSEELTEIESPTTWTTADYAAAVESMPAGRFMATAPDEARCRYASLWGGPFFALRQLAPDLLELDRPVRIVCGGAISLLTLMSGRWLSLYGKALALPSGFSLELWSEHSPSKPPRRIVKKPVLLQPTQKIVKKRWSAATEEEARQADLLVLYAPEKADEILGFAEELAGTSHDRIVVSALHKTHAILLRKLLVDCGFHVGPIVTFDPIIKAHVHGLGTTWFELRRGDGLVAAPEDVLEAIRPVASSFEGAVTAWKGRKVDPSRVCEGYGATRVVSATGLDSHKALMLTDFRGVCLEDGKWFDLADEASSGATWLKMSQPSPELLAAAPVLESCEPMGGMSMEEVHRYEGMVWLASYLEEHMDAKTSKEPEPEETGEAEPAIEEVDSTGHAPEEITPSVDAPRGLEPAVSGSPDPAPPRSARNWRLSRSAGTTDVMAIACLLGKDGQGASTLIKARRNVLRWLKNKGYEDLPEAEPGHASAAEGEVSVETDGKRVWAMRFDDRKQMEQGAFWRVELTLLDVGNACALGIRIYQLRRSESAPEPISGAPSVLAKLGTELGLRDAGAFLLSKAHRISDRAGGEWLAGLLHQPERSMAVVVVSSTAANGPDGSVDRMAARLTGVAHVVTIDPSAAHVLSSRMAEGHAVYGNAIRVYRPNVRQDDPPGDHPLWTFGGQTLPLHVMNLAVEAACSISVDHEDLDERAPSFRQVRQELSDSRLAMMRSTTDSLASTVEEERAKHLRISAELEETVKEQREQLEELTTKLRNAQEEVKALRRERDQAIDDLRQHRHQLNTRWLDDDQAYEEVGEEVEYPDNWDDLETWAEVYCGDTLVLLPSAAKAAKDSLYEDIPFAYQALHLLANQYVAMRTRDPDDEQPKLDFEARRLSLGLVCSKVGDAPEVKRFKQEYRRVHEGETITLDMHLKKGAGYDPTSLFRLYFYYCEQTSRVIVGHLPSHLTNHLTHNA